MAYTGFEPEMQPFSATIPTEWKSWKCLWWDPTAITPKGYYWKEVGVDHPALSLGNLCTTEEFVRAPTIGEIIRRWFTGSRELLHHACKSVVCVLRHTCGRGTPGQSRRAGVPPVPMSTFGWVEMHHLTAAVKASTNARHLDTAGMITAIKNETVERGKEAEEARQVHDAHGGS